MPTGYTAELIEKNLSFKQFTMRCARAFGALVDMRDDPADAPIPEEFKPSDYHEKQIQIAKDELASLKAMSQPEILAFGRAELDKEISSYEQSIERDNATNTKLLAMAEQVNAWEPPSPEHVELKEFMLNQLKISLEKTSYWHEHIKELRDKSPMKVYGDAVDAARRSVQYHIDEHAKEIERTNNRNRWIRQLRESLQKQTAGV